MVVYLSLKIKNATWLWCEPTCKYHDPQTDLDPYDLWPWPNPPGPTGENLEIFSTFSCVGFFFSYMLIRYCLLTRCDKSAEKVEKISRLTQGNFPDFFSSRARWESTLVQWFLVQSIVVKSQTETQTDRQTDRKWCIWAHRAYAQVCSNIKLRS